jgi:hypothetical protein
MESEDHTLDSQFNETPAELLTDESDAMRMKQVKPTIHINPLRIVHCTRA